MQLLGNACKTMAMQSVHSKGLKALRTAQAGFA